MGESGCEAENHLLSAGSTCIPADPVFERCWWIYSLCRERFFADHTETIANALQPLLRSQLKIQLLEVGCGPGFYSRRLAARFPYVQAMGIDTSERLISHARNQALRAKLGNCRFLRADAHDMQLCLERADVAIASRLFLILAQRDRVLSAIFETLRPGGIFFAAEPTSPLRTALPLWLMRAANRLYGAPAVDALATECRVLSRGQFCTLIGGQPWSKVQIWQDRRYQYALCEKAS